jgi:uncharacterized protein (TIGR02996 family)
MSTNDTLLQAILNNPEDDAVRLIYSDWLEEHGESARAQFIRVQCALAQLSGSAPKHTERITAGEYRVECDTNQLSEAEQHWVTLRACEGQLMLDHRDNLTTSLNKPLEELGFRWSGYEPDVDCISHRGFVDELEVYKGDRGAQAFARQATAVFGVIPLTALRLRPMEPFGVQYSFTPDIQFAPTNPVSYRTLESLVMQPCFKRLGHLDLNGNDLDDESAKLLLRSPNITGLTRIDLGSIRHYPYYAAEPRTLSNRFSSETRQALVARFGLAVRFEEQSFDR